MCFEPKMSASNSLLLKSIPEWLPFKAFRLKADPAQNNAY